MSHTPYPVLPKGGVSCGLTSPCASSHPSLSPVPGKTRPLAAFGGSMATGFDCVIMLLPTQLVGEVLVLQLLRLWRHATQRGACSPWLRERGALFGVENPRRQYTLLETYRPRRPERGVVVLAVQAVTRPVLIFKAICNRRLEHTPGHDITRHGDPAHPHLAQ